MKVELTGLTDSLDSEYWKQKRTQELVIGLGNWEVCWLLLEARCIETGGCGSGS